MDSEDDDGKKMIEAYRAYFMAYEKAKKLHGVETTSTPTNATVEERIDADLQRVNEILKLKK